MLIIGYHRMVSSVLVQALMLEGAKNAAYSIKQVHRSGPQRESRIDVTCWLYGKWAYKIPLSTMKDDSTMQEQQQAWSYKQNLPDCKERYAANNCRWKLTRRSRCHPKPRYNALTLVVKRINFGCLWY